MQEKLSRILLFLSICYTNKSLYLMLGSKYDNILDVINVYNAADVNKLPLIDLIKKKLTKNNRENISSQ